MSTVSSRDDELSLTPAPGPGHNGGPALDELLSLSVQDACARTGFSRAQVYRLLAAGRLKSFTLGKRRYVDAVSLRELIAELSAQPEPDKIERQSRGRDGRWGGSKNYSAAKRQAIPGT